MGDVLQGQQEVYVLIPAKFGDGRVPYLDMFADELQLANSVV